LNNLLIPSGSNEYTEEPDDTNEALMKIETDRDRSMNGAELADLLKSKVPATRDDRNQKSPSALVLNEFFGESAIQLATKETHMSPSDMHEISTKRAGLHIVDSDDSMTEIMNGDAGPKAFALQPQTPDDTATALE
jgi:hypothetical protein